MAGEIYEFAGFRLLAATRELRRPDGSTSLVPARIFDCVLYLIEHRARAIGRDELIAAVWNQPEVGDNVLAQLLARTRKLLSDDGGEQRVIRTVPGFGYHWVAPTLVSAAAAPAEPPVAADAEPSPITATPEPPPAPPQRRRYWIVPMLLGVVLLAGAAALWSLYGNRDAGGNAHVAPASAIPGADGDPPPLPLAQRPALVLPAVVDPAEGQGWLRLGIMAIVAERLAGAGRTTVPSDNSVALTKGRDPATLDAADAPPTAALSQTGQIERLLGAIAALDGARFLRNGKDYSPADAAAHLRRKWQSARRSAADDDAAHFIDALASTSSVSGLPYRIRFADGRETTVREFLRDELARLQPP